MDDDGKYPLDETRDVNASEGWGAIVTAGLLNIEDAAPKYCGATIDRADF